MTTLNDQTERVTAVLKQHFCRVVTAQDSSWHFQPREAAGCCVKATLDDDWLTLVVSDAPDLLQDSTPWDLLRRNAALPGFAKFAVMPDGRLELRAEFPLPDEADPGERLRETCAGFESACAVYRFVEAESNPETAEGKLDLKQLGAEAGWPFVERGAGKLLVELETRDNYWQAAMVHAGRGINLSCELAAGGALADECRAAVAELLLSVSGILRLARPSVVSDSVRLEVAFLTPPSPVEISGALESLSVGCSLCGEEIKTLQDPAMARRFLELQGRNARALAL